MLKFQENFFKGEVREEFEIEPLMKCVWAEQIEVLSNILKVCNELDIKEQLLKLYDRLVRIYNGDKASMFQL